MEYLWIIQIILFTVLMIIFVYISRELASLTRKDEHALIPVLAFFSYLIRPRIHFKNENIGEGYALNISLIVIIILLVYLLKNLINS